jgi:hypothetical protein
MFGQLFGGWNFSTWQPYSTIFNHMPWQPYSPLRCYPSNMNTVNSANSLPIYISGSEQQKIWPCGLVQSRVTTDFSFTHKFQRQEKRFFTYLHSGSNRWTGIIRTSWRTFFHNQQSNAKYFQIPYHPIIWPDLITL